MAFDVHVLANVSASCKRALEFFKASLAHCFFQFIFRIIGSAVRACILYTEDRNVQSQQNYGLNFRCKRKRPRENEFCNN